MPARKLITALLLTSLVLCIVVTTCGRQAARDAIESITADELYTHLKFISSDEFMGRDTPSPELKMAARYLATQVESYGFKPLTADGSYLQRIPLETVAVSAADSRLRVGTRTFRFPADFSGRINTAGTFSGEVVFVGFGVNAPDVGWDDYGEVDLTDKVVVMLEGRLPEDHELMQDQNRRNIWMRSFVPRQKDAAMVLTVISEQREKEMARDRRTFPVSRRTTMVDQGGGGARRGMLSSFMQVEIRHRVATEILGVSRDELSGMFSMIGEGRQVPRRTYPGRRVEMTIGLNREEDYTQNVVAVLEGTDPELKDEYVLFGSHYDHVGVRSGTYPDSIRNGADDDGSGTVAMLEIAEAMAVERPRRSVVMVWHTGEEKGLWGARHFVSNSSIPLENISAQIQMDMLSRNEPDSIYVIGTHFLSSELDQISEDVARRLGLINLSNRYNDPDMPGNFHSQSDHYAYHVAGIPAIFYFCGVHEDLHQPTDTIEKCDMDKLERVTKLVYAVGLEIGNRDALLKLDRDPEVTSRGLHNLERPDSR